MAANDDAQETIRIVRPHTRATCTIRPPLVDDYDRMADLARQLGYASAGEQIRLRIERMKADDYAVFVAEVSTGQIAGWVGMYIFRSVEMDDCAFISGLIVDEALRSQEIGRVLLGVAEEWARRRDCRAICVSSNVIRNRAHGFYLKNGYRKEKTQIVFLKNLDEGELCAKRSSE